MRLIEAPRKVVVAPGGLVGNHVATVEDETNGKRYAFIEQWQPPWQAPSAPMVGWGVWEVSAKGNIDFSKVSDALSEVAEVVEKAGLKRPVSSPGLDDKTNYTQLVTNLARLAVDLALENDYYKRQMGEIAHFRELPETMKRLREFQPPLNTLEKASYDKEAADAVQGILTAIRQLLR